MKRNAIFLVILLFLAACGNKKIQTASPDGIISAEVSIAANGFPALEVSYGNRKIVNSSVSALVTDQIKGSHNFRIINSKVINVRNNWVNKFGERSNVPDNYNEASLELKSGESVMKFIIRVYNEGVAFSYGFPGQEGTDSLKIDREEIRFRFDGNYVAWSAPMAQARYNKVSLNKIDKGCERPLVVEIDSALTVALAEAKLVDFARMKFDPDTFSENCVISRLDGPVKLKTPFMSPWRVIMIGKSAGDLLEKNYLLLNLNDPSAIDDVSWIQPGKALREVTLTTTGAKAAIDFISSHNMQYVEFDAGWYGPEYNDSSDARAVNLDPKRSKGPMDMDEITRYAKSKGIRIMLYVNRRALEKQLDELLPIYRNWGIGGIKFGFVQTGSQESTAWLHEAIRKTAAYRMVADVHDEYRPTGYARTYPNWLSQEGIRGDEESPSNSHTLITMFTRMLAGAGDNTVCYYNERVDNKMGSHASQLAKTVCIFSPLQFLYWYDKASPSLEKKDGLWGTTNYIGDEPELVFFNDVPTVWDETKVLYAKIGEYGIIARRKGNEWFIGGINGENKFDRELRFDFLEAGKKYKVEIYSDDKSVNTRTHVRTETIEADSGSSYRSVILPNNGIAMHISPV